MRQFDKRYQVFLSSTFEDLEEERKEVMTALQLAGYFVAGMELFPSDDDESWEVIKRVIDQSDYYVLVVGGKYGSIGKGGKSFTEMEYEYAISQNVPLLAFPHGNPSDLPHRKTETKHPDKLAEFRKRIDRHQRQTWATKHDLATMVLASLSHAVNLKPRPGWVRGDLAVRLEEIRQRYDRIREERDVLLQKLSDGHPDTDLAGDDDVIVVPLVVHFEGKDQTKSLKYTKEVSWSVIFDAIAPQMIGWTYTNRLERLILDSIGGDLEPGPSIAESQGAVAFDDDFVTKIRNQFVATELIMVDRTEVSEAHGVENLEIWKLSEKGLRKWCLKQAIRRAQSP